MSGRTILRRLVAVCAVAVAALLGGTVTAGPAAATTVPGAASASWDAWSIYRMINYQRAGHGIPALNWNPALISAAGGHNGWMAYYDQLSHQLSGEHSLAYRIPAAGYTPWSAIAENLAVTTNLSISGVTAVETNMYNEGPTGGHYLNLMNPTYRDVGVAVTFDAQHSLAWVTIDFGAH
jgi:uncharacterized protein YkwD